MVDKRKRVMEKKDACTHQYPPALLRWRKTKEIAQNEKIDKMKPTVMKEKDNHRHAIFYEPRYSIEKPTPVLALRLAEQEASHRHYPDAYTLSPEYPKRRRKFPSLDGCQNERHQVRHNQGPEGRVGKPTFFHRRREHACSIPAHTPPRRTIDTSPVFRYAETRL